MYFVMKLLDPTLARVEWLSMGQPHNAARLGAQTTVTDEFAPIGLYILVIFDRAF